MATCPFVIFLDKILVQARHKRNLSSMKPFLLSLQEKMFAGEITEEEMKEAVAKEMARRGGSSRGSTSAPFTPSDCCEDENVWFMDRCDKYRTLTHRTAQKLQFMIGRVAQGKAGYGECLVVFTLTFLSAVSAFRFHKHLRKRLRHSCSCGSRDSSECFVDRSLRSDVPLGSGWSAEEDGLFADLHTVSRSIWLSDRRNATTNKILLSRWRSALSKYEKSKQTSALTIDEEVILFETSKVKRKKRRKRKKKNRSLKRRAAAQTIQRACMRFVFIARLRRMRAATIAIQKHARATWRRRRQLVANSCDTKTRGTDSRGMRKEDAGRCFQVVPNEIKLAMVVPPEALLAKEIECFGATMSKMVHLMALSYRKTMQELRRVIQSIFPCAMLSLYGSIATRLALPSSDLDIVILHRHKIPCNGRHSLSFAAPCLLHTPNPVDQLHLVLHALMREPWIKSPKLVGQTFPLLKLTVSPQLMPSGYVSPAGADHKIDISSGMTPNHSGIEAAAWLNKQCDARPILRPLILVLKQLVREGNVGDTWTGGIGSFTLSLLLVRLLQWNDSEHDTRRDCFPCSPESIPAASSSKLDAGRILLQFLKFYGVDFDCSVGISVTNGGCFFPLESSSPGGNSRRALVVISPLRSNTNVAAGIFRFHDVQNCFARAYEALMRAFELYLTGKTKTLLRSLLRLKWGAGSQREDLLMAMRRRLQTPPKKKRPPTRGS